MQMYVNYYDRHVKLPEENPTIGLLLCKEKKDAVVKLTLPKDANIHAKEYQLYLPSKELLKAKLLEWTREEEATSLTEAQRRGGEGDSPRRTRRARREEDALPLRRCEKKGSR